MASTPAKPPLPSLLLVLLLALWQTEAGTRHYKWSVGYLDWAPDCVDATVIAVNGQSPGPTIYAEQGDRIVVELTNEMPTESVVIHWHGIRQRGTPWSDGTPSVTQCAVPAGEKYIYTFVVDQAGTYFYHGHYGMQRTAGLYGSLIVKSKEPEPFRYDAELSILLDDWWHKSVYEQAAGLSSIPFQWVGEPHSLLINGRGTFDCSADTGGSVCNASNPQCAPRTVLPVTAGRTYRLRVASVASLSSINLAIQGHNMTVVEADGHFVEPFETSNLDVYSGETYSVLVTANQDRARNYWVSTNVRGRKPATPPGLAILSYDGTARSPTGALPATPAWNDFHYSMSLARRVKALKGPHNPPPPARPDRVLKLLNTQNRVNGYLKWSLNHVSLVTPATPYLAAMKYGIRNAFSAEAPPDTYTPADYDIWQAPANPNATGGDGVYVLKFGTVVDVVLQNANTLTPNNSEVHPWHLHGHDFWVLGYGHGVYNESTAVRSLNMKNPPLRNTVALFPYGWTLIRFRANNPGVWAFHCHVEAHYFMGMGVVFAEGVDGVGSLPYDSMGCGLTRDRFMPIP